MKSRSYPSVELNLSAIANNSRILCNLCKKNGISVAGVIKFSDGNLQVAKAYLEGGCAQVAVSRAVHLKPLKEALPHAETLLTRSPTRGDLEACARFADLSLHADADLLKALNAEAAKWNAHPGILLMLDCGDLREGTETVEELTELARLCESLSHLNLRGIGANFACLNGILPTKENLSFLLRGVEAVEEAVGRPMEIISGGSTINLLLLQNGINQMPARINHLRLGGSIANPINLRLNRGLTFPGLREDTVLLTAEIIEIREKPSVPAGESTKNWAGKEVTREDRGRRLRAILALGSQDIGDASSLIPVDPTLQILGCSSDHTVVDVTDSPQSFRSGDLISFRLRYGNMLCAFTGKHVSVEYQHDPN